MSAAFYEEFGRRVSRRRRIMQLKQHEVGAAIGTKRPHISAIEHGKQRMMRVEQVAQLARILQTSSDYLLQLVEEDLGRSLPGCAQERGEAWKACPRS